MRDFKYQLTYQASKLTMDMPTTAFYFISAAHCQAKCPISPTYHVWILFMIQSWCLQTSCALSQHLSNATKLENAFLFYYRIQKNRDKQTDNVASRCALSCLSLNINIYIYLFCFLPLIMSTHKNGKDRNQQDWNSEKVKGLGSSCNSCYTVGSS